MDSPNYFNWTSKARLEEFKSRIDSRSSSRRTTKLDEFKKNLFSSFRSSPLNDYGNSKETPSKDYSVGISSPYNSTKNFNSNSIVKKIEIKVNKKFVSANNYEKISESKSVKSLFNEYPSPKFRMNKTNSLEGKSLNELISVGTLIKAGEIVNETDLQQLPRTYLRQLKQFCNEALLHLNN